MDIHTSSIGHTIEYVQLNSIENWLFASKDNKMPVAFETMKTFLAERPLVVKANGHEVHFTSFIHYCLSKPAMINKEASFTIKLAQVFSKCEMGFLVDLLLTEDHQGLNCYDVALTKNYKQLAIFFERTIETYNLKHHNQNAPEILNAFINPDISVAAFTTKIKQIDPKVFEATLQTSNGIQMNCAQAILVLQKAYPNESKTNAIEALLGKEKHQTLLNKSHSLSSLFSQSHNASMVHEQHSMISNQCTQPPKRTNTYTL